MQDVEIYILIVRFICGKLKSGGMWKALSQQEETRWVFSPQIRYSKANQKGVLQSC